MKVKSKILKRLVRFFSKNYLISIFVLVAIVTLGLIFYKSFLAKTNYAYVRVQINYPESYYTKPDIWLARSLKKGVSEEGLLGQKEAEVLGVTYYPNTNDLTQTQLNIYLDLKLQVGYNASTGEYSFQRNTIAVGSPITLNFSTTHIIGTILYIGNKPLANNYVDKTIYLVWTGGFKKSSPYLYNSIKIGDAYFNGESDVFKIIDKKLEENVFAVVNNFTSQVTEGSTDTTQDIVLVARVKLLKVNNLLVFGGSQIITEGESMNLVTDDGLNLSSFVISAIQ